MCLYTLSECLLCLGYASAKHYYDPEGQLGIPYLIPRLPLELPRDKACIYISLREFMVNLTHCGPTRLYHAHLQCLPVTSAVCAQSSNEG